MISLNTIDKIKFENKDFACADLAVVSTYILIGLQHFTKVEYIKINSFCNICAVPLSAHAALVAA